MNRYELASRLLIFFVFLLHNTVASAQERPSELEPVVVTASRIARKLPSITRQLEVINREDIVNASADSVPELLSELSLVDVRQRAPGGTQADLSIRGSTFSQVLVLVDGQRMNDPQTGHHTLDLPVPVGSIERIEVLRGAGSSLYGPDAFGGVINIITRKAERRQAAVTGEVGDFGTWHTAFDYADRSQSWGTVLTGARNWSDGHRRGTDYDITTLSWKLSADSSRGPLDFLAGLTEKEFGADGFFSPFPSREETQTLWLSLGGELEMGSNSTLSPRLSYRRHADDFILDSTRPDWYVNHHVTHLYEATLQPVLNLDRLGNLAIVAEWAEERIESSALGKHADNRLAFGLEHRLPAPGLTTFLWGLRIDHHSHYGTEISPSVGLAYTPRSGYKITASVNRAFRAPSFTERFYVSPANLGNPHLEAETAWAYEVGASFAPCEWFQADAAFFLRDAKDLIDWVRSDPSEPWRAMNIGEVRTHGLELRLSAIPHPTADVTLDYAFLDVDEWTGPLLSKYVLAFPAHDLALRLRAPFLRGIRQQWVGRYTYRKGVDRHFLLGCRFSKGIGRVALFVEGQNLLGEEYEDIPGVPMPGRYVGGGVRVVW